MTQTSILRFLAPKPTSTDRPLLQEANTAQTDVQTTTTEDVELIGFTSACQDLLSYSVGTAARKSQDGVIASLIPGTSIVRVDLSHLNAIKQLTATTLPMRYPHKFFEEVVTNEEVGDFARVALFEEQPVGWIRCRLEPVNTLTSTPDRSPGCQIYVQALCLLAPYRQRGFASQLLKEVTRPHSLQKYGATTIYAHVWEDNEDALGWYEKRGFKQMLLVGQYYRRLRPSGAWIVRKELG